MPGMTGVELLERAQGTYPQARRVLLTAYADTEAAIRAINSARISYYLTKPWDPPEERLYPVLDDLLEDWNAGYRPPFEGIRVVGPRWSLMDHRVRNFLSRNQVPYVWLDPERDDQAVDLLQKFGVDDSKLPVVLFPGWDSAGAAGVRASWHSAWGCGPRRSRTSTTWWWWARGWRGWRQRCMALQRD